MASQWFYVRDGQRQGPVTADQLKSMAAAGALGPDDLVWTDYMSEWMPTRRVPSLALTGAAPPAAAAPVYEETFAPAAPLAQHQTLAYQTPGRDATPVTPRTVDMLRQTRPWVMLMGILIFLVAGFIVVVGLIALVAAASAGQAAGLGIMMAGVYIAISLLYIFPAYFLMRYASCIANLSYRKRAGDLEAALEAQKKFWKFVGIVTLVVICIYVVIFVVGFLLMGAFAFRR